jgi:hypothetical protein
MTSRNGLQLQGGALCAACRSPRPFAELLAFARITDAGLDMSEIRYVCRPSISDMRMPLCTSRAIGAVAQHAIALATDVERLRREAARPHRAPRPTLPNHIREYAGAAA